MVIDINHTNAILNRIVDGQVTAADLNLLRQLLSPGHHQENIQLGKYNINISQGEDI